MHKRDERRNDAPAGVRSGTNIHIHLSDEQLLLALDGELLPFESARVGGHLEACWSCRVRSAQIEEAITDVVEYRDCLISAYPAFSPSSKTMFMARLDQLTRSLDRPSLGVRLAGLFRELLAFSQGVLPRHVWLSGIIIAAFMLFSFTSFRQVPEVPKVPETPEISANQLLEYAQGAELRALHSVPNPVVYQKLRIQAGNHDVTRTIYRDLNGRRRTDRLSINGNGEEPARVGGSSSQRTKHSNSRLVESDLEQIFRAARLDWEDPLSPVSYRSWRDSLSQKQDEVSKGSNEFITLKTTTVRDPIATASVTIRKADFHPVAGEFRLWDMREIEVEELDWRVIPLEVVNPAIFVVEPDVSPVNPRPMIQIPVGPTAPDLAESELQARVALHAAGADLGEEIEFDRDTTNFANHGQRSLILRGILASPERRDELLAGLRGIPNLELQLQTVEDAKAKEDQSTQQEFQGMVTLLPLAHSSPGFVPNTEESRGQESHEIAKLMAEDTVVGRGSLDEILQEHFPRAEERTAFVNRVIDLTQNALAQGWALRRLRDRYTAEEVGRLSQGSKRTLELLVHDHVLALRRSVDGTRQAISTVLAFEPVVPAAPKANHDASTTGPTDDWRDAVTEIFPVIQKMDSDAAILFAQPDRIISDQQARIRELHSTLIRLETDLSFLYRHVSGAFLREPQVDEAIYHE